MQFIQAPIIEREYIGVNDNLPPEQLPKGFFKKADNVFVFDNKIEKVFGSTAIAASIDTKAFNGLGSFENLTSGNKYLVANINGASVSQAYSWNGSGTFSAITGLTSTNSNPMWFETANNYIFGVDGINVWDWDGTTATKNRAGVPVGTTLSWFHNYLFNAGVLTYPNRLYWSNLGDPTTYAGANLVDINPGDGDKIMTLARTQDELLVLKRNTIWSITGFSGATFSATTIAAQNTNNRIIGYGIIAPFSAISTGNDVYFLSYLGDVPVIRSVKKTMFATTLSGGIISHEIEGTMSLINKTYLSGITGIYDGRFCYWSIPVNSSTTNNCIIVLDTFGIKRVKGKTVYPWTTMTGKNATYFALSTISGSAVIYYAETGTTGLVIKFDKSLYSDKGSAIAIDVINRSFMPDPARKQHWKYLYNRVATGVTSTVTVKARVDEATDYTTQGTISLASSSRTLGSFVLGTDVLTGTSTKRSRINFAGMVGKNISVEYTESSTSAVTIYDQEFYYISKGLRGS